MNVLIVHAHPSATSFNAALRDAAADEARALGHDVTMSDLYADRFDPAGGPNDFLAPANPDRFHYQSEQSAAALNDGFVPEIAREQARLRAADLLILQFPLWWGGPPAILKGWIDRVAAYGVAYADGTRFEAGLFRGRRALISVTTGGTPARFSDDGVYGPIDKVLWPVQHLFLDYLGYAPTPPQVSYAAARVTGEERAGMIAALRARVRDLLATPVAAPPVPEPAELLTGAGARRWDSPS